MRRSRTKKVASEFDLVLYNVKGILKRRANNMKVPLRLGLDPTTRLPRRTFSGILL